MVRISNTEFILLSASSFIAGVGLGLLLAPRSGKRNRRWIADHATEFAHWVDEKGHDTLTKSEEQLQKIRQNLQKGYRDTVPDLYEATEQIDLEDSGLINR